MEIILPEQNYSLDEINNTIYTAVKGYIENIRLLKIANYYAVHTGKKTKLIIPFPTFNQYRFDWKWNKDFYNSRRTIKTGDDLTLRLEIRLYQSLDGINISVYIEVSISATKVRKNKKTNKLGYIFKTITEIYSNDLFVAKVSNRPGLYSTGFLSNISWETDDETTTYSYGETQVQHNKTTLKRVQETEVLHIPKGQVKGIDVSYDVKMGLPMYDPITLISMNGTDSAFASFVKKMKRN